MPTETELKDINGKKPKVGDRVRIFSNFYDIEEIERELWACQISADPHDLLLKNWNECFEIVYPK